MLTRTFIHLPGVGYATEARWWRQGITDWAAFLERLDGLQPSAPTISFPALCRAPTAITSIRESETRLAARDHPYFARTLARRDHWRAVPEFADRIAFLDIETTGGVEGEDITVIGLADSRSMRVFVKGRDLEAFPEAVAPYALLVTFFGTGFDVPMLKRRFPHLPFDQLHVDLCYGLKRLGYHGGLKKIEAQLGLERAPETRGLTGWDAVRLWREYRRGSREALELLLRYNEEDVLNMRQLLALAYNGLWEQATAR
jgi:uncharacterized protein YprB with RNaseH-like and TPR domain